MIIKIENLKSGHIEFNTVLRVLNVINDELFSPLRKEYNETNSERLKEYSEPTMKIESGSIIICISVVSSILSLIDIGGRLASKIYKKIKGKKKRTKEENKENQKIEQNKIIIKNDDYSITITKNDETN